MSMNSVVIYNKTKNLLSKGSIALLLLLALPGYAQSQNKPALQSGENTSTRLLYTGFPNEFVSSSFTPDSPRLPVIAVKSNLLYDLTTTMNLGIEVGLAHRWTLDIPFNYNPWKFDDETRFRHWGVQPEIRYWFCNRFDGWFVGLHGHYAKFNVGGLPDWFFISENMQQNRYQGHLYGAGVSVGYSWILKKRWSLEATIGGGYTRLVFDKYPCAECGTSMGKQTKNYFGPTKVGLSLVFMIK